MATIPPTEILILAGFGTYMLSHWPVFLLSVLKLKKGEFVSPWNALCVTVQVLINIFAEEDFIYTDLFLVGVWEFGLHWSQCLLCADLVLYPVCVDLVLYPGTFPDKSKEYQTALRTFWAPTTYDLFAKLVVTDTNCAKWEFILLHICPLFPTNYPTN